ncbi:hypothetical protein RJ527_08645 [Thalassospiraceae bacterium LMO-SO8]|nr:hypothetical protein [Alphaproteobacteria bacterium LMO-S08]WND77798.1 hypothetical protein RJ527_08645 [Thalassospiraceae bacterium LMO-SO8]
MGGTTGGPKDLPNSPTPIETPAANLDDMAPGLPGRGGTDGFGGFGQSFLTQGVGHGQANLPDDVFQASGFLAANGLLPAPTRDADDGFLRGIENGQKRLNDLAGGGLQIDGIAKPWGPTEILSQRAVTSGKMAATSVSADRPPSAHQVQPAAALRERQAKVNASILRSARAPDTKLPQPPFTTSSLPTGEPPTAVPATPPAEPKRSLEQKSLVSDRITNATLPSIATKNPILTDPIERTDAILNNASARFEVKENPNADDSDPWYAVPSVGKTAVLNFEPLLIAEARKQGVDPDLVKAIVYAENARGHYFGTAKMLEGFQLAGTIFPMNIDPEKWSGLGIDKNSAYAPESNVKAGVTLIKRIFDRVPNPSPAKIASVWNYVGRENVNDFGAYVARIYREKPWTK